MAQMDNQEKEKLLEQMPCGIALVEVMLNGDHLVEDTHLIFVNQTLTEIFELTREELLGAYGKVMSENRNVWKGVFYEAAYQNINSSSYEYVKSCNKYIRVNCFPYAPGICGCMIIDEQEHYIREQRALMDAYRGSRGQEASAADCS